MPPLVRSNCFLVVVGFLPSRPVTAHLYVKPTMTNLRQLPVWRHLVWWLLVLRFLVRRLPDRWFFSLAVLVDDFGFGGGWFRGFATAGCAASGVVAVGLVAVGFEALGSAAASLAAVGFKQQAASGTSS